MNEKNPWQVGFDEAREIRSGKPGREKAFRFFFPFLFFLHSLTMDRPSIVPRALDPEGPCVYGSTENTGSENAGHAISSIQSCLLVIV